MSGHFVLKILNESSIAIQNDALPSSIKLQEKMSILNSRKYLFSSKLLAKNDLCSDSHCFQTPFLPGYVYKLLLYISSKTV